MEKSQRRHWMVPAMVGWVTAFPHAASVEGCWKALSMVLGRVNSRAAILFCPCLSILLHVAHDPMLG